MMLSICFAVMRLTLIHCDSVQNSESWLKRLNSLLWGYEDLRKQLCELVQKRKKVVGSSASNGSPEYLIAEHEGEPVWKRRPLEMYYRPRPTEVHKEMVMCLELFLKDEF